MQRHLAKFNKLVDKHLTPDQKERIRTLIIQIITILEEKH